MEDLGGKVSIVTGGAMGIGKEISLRLAKDGSDIAIVDIEREIGQKVVDEVKAMGRRSIFSQVDVSQWDQVREAVDEVLKNYKKIDILVNSAGILGPVVTVLDYSVEDWSRIIQINLMGTFFFCKAVLPAMIKQKSGRIVNLASIAGKEGNAYMSAYSSSKAAVIGFTKSLAKEVAPHNIVVNCVSPAVIETRMGESIGEEQRKVLLQKIPMGRFGQPYEVAALVKFLVSEECMFSTGQCYDISGGRAVY
jgi:NAD(P)-dependent dehydrogenase (short-subunit alcohol dehydrogenase family)